MDEKNVTDKDEKLTPSGESGSPSAGTPTIPSEEEELSPKAKAGFQKALQKSRRSGYLYLYRREG